MDFGDAGPKGNVLTAGQQTELFGILLAGAVFSSAISGWIGGRWGRKAGIFLGALTGLVNPIIQATVTSWSALMVAKFISGIGIGFGQTFVIPYWSETTPAMLRGLVLVALQGIINIFTLVGSSINEGTHNMTTRWAYRIPLLTELLAPGLLLILLYWIPETPRWLVSRERPGDAIESMKKLRGPTYPEDEVVMEVKEIVAMDRIEKELEGSTRWSDLFKGTDLRRTTISVIAILCQEFSGIAFITG
jgi:MFS transporter, SP family, sugar:H+ symporter